MTRRLRKLSMQQEHPWGLATAKRCDGIVELATGYADEAVGALEQASAGYGAGLRFDGRGRCSHSVGRSVGTGSGAQRGGPSKPRGCLRRPGIPRLDQETRAAPRRRSPAAAERSAQPGRAAGRGAGGRRARQQGDRPGALPVREDGRGTPLATSTRSSGFARGHSSPAACPAPGSRSRQVLHESPSFSARSNANPSAGPRKIKLPETAPWPQREASRAGLSGERLSSPRWTSTSGGGTGSRALVLTGGARNRQDDALGGRDRRRAGARDPCSSRPGERGAARLAFAGLIDLLDGVDLRSLEGVPAPQLAALEVAPLRVERGQWSRTDRGAISFGVRNALRALAADGPLLVAVDDQQRAVRRERAQRGPDAERDRAAVSAASASELTTQSATSSAASWGAGAA